MKDLFDDFIDEILEIITMWFAVFLHFLAFLIGFGTPCFIIFKILEVLL